ncbi:MAG: hypothetical protein U0R44_06375 [Candidatus Micrarchaeia archaeon]
MADTIDLIKQLVEGKDYHAALARVREFKRRISESSDFRLGSVVEDAEAYFSELRKKSPHIYDMLKIHRKEIAEMVVQKRTGSQIIID